LHVKALHTHRWTYGDTETAYILEGEVTVTPKDGRAPVTVGAGDLVVFPEGLSCTWDVKKVMHYDDTADTPLFLIPRLSELTRSPLSARQ